MAPSRLLFVCSGNICRSPMAEGIALLQADRVGLPVDVQSAGTLGLEDRPADPKSVKVCREIGVDLRDFRSQGLSQGLVDWADTILVMELAHLHHLHGCYPGSGDKSFLLGHFDGSLEIPDPIGGWTFTFRRIRKRIESGVEAFLRQQGRR